MPEPPTLRRRNPGRPGWLLPVLAGGVWLAAMTGSSLARAAETQLGLDADLAFPLDDIEVDRGGGANVRLGRRLDMTLLTLTGEALGGYHQFGGAMKPRVYRGAVGARLGIGAVVRAVGFAHAGLGHATFTQPEGSFPDLGRTAFAYDAGGGLDFTLLPLLDLGVHGAYNAVAAGSSESKFTWATVGAHAELVF